MGLAPGASNSKFLIIGIWNTLLSKISWEMIKVVWCNFDIWLALHASNANNCHLVYFKQHVKQFGLILKQL